MSLPLSTLSELILTNTYNKTAEIYSEPFGSYLFKHGISKEVRSKVFMIESQSGKRITYGQLEEQAHSLARSMLSLMFFGPDDICTIMSESSIQYAITISACLILNIPYTLVKPAFGSYQLAQQLIQTESKWLFISRELYPKVEHMFKNCKFSYLKTHVQIIVMDNDQSDNPINDCSTMEKLISAFQGLQHRIDPIPYYSKSLDDIVSIVFTSGSTGKPKGVCHTHRSLLSNAIHMKQFKPLVQHRHLNMLLTFPLGHVSGNCILFLALLSQTPVVLFNYKEINNIFHIIQKYQIGQVFGAPNIMNILAKNKQPNDDISSVQLVLTAGCKLPSSTADILFNQYHIKILDSYGCTECNFISANENCDDIPNNVGKVLQCLEMKIIDINTKEQLRLPGQSGEICFRGPSRFREYYKNPDETSLAIDSYGWFHTGDVGHVDEDGNLHITDRIKEIIKFKGWSVYPAEIECFLITHEAVLDVVVVPVKHKEYNQVPRAYVALKDRHRHVTSEQLDQYVNDNLGFHQRLRGGIIVIDQLKYTFMGKVDRQYFKCLCADELLQFIED